MAWGFWNKIKKGFQKVGRAIVKGAKWVNDKVLKWGGLKIRVNVYY